jgi:transposase
MHDRTLLNDWQWEIIQPLLPPVSGLGRPRADDRLVLEGILWVLRSGARWRDLPQRYPSASTCWRRLRDWEEEDLWLQIWRVFLSALDAQGRLNWDEVFLDGSFASAKKGGSAWVKPNVAKVQSGWWWQTAKVYLWEADSLTPRPRKSLSRKKP